MRTCWTKEEILYLTELYETQGLASSELYPIFIKKYCRTIEAVKVKLGRLKLKHTKEQIRQLKSRLNAGDLNGMFGKSSPMKGLTKDNSETIRVKSIKLSETRKKLFKEGLLPLLTGDKNPMYGKISWCNGLTKYTDERLMIIGSKSSINAKQRWCTKTQEEKDVIINRLNKSMIQTKVPTKIENKLNDYLTSLSLNFIKNHRLGIFLVDFYLPDYNLVIECDGDYWHSNPMFYKNKILNEIQNKNKDRDSRKENMLTINNINFIRFWEFDIHNNFELVKEKIWEKLQKK